MIDIKFKKLTDDATVPTRGSKGAAGFDLYSREPWRLFPGERHLFSTGIAMQVPDFCFGHICPRSSLAMKGIDVMAGVVDSDYRGDIGVLLINHSDSPVEISTGDRIAQMVIQSHNGFLHTAVVDELDDTDRGDGGYGSTGK